MKKIFLISGLLALFSATSCREEYLEKSPTETISEGPAKTKLNGVYVMLAKPGTGGTTNHDDFGQKGIDIYSDLLSSDMVLAGLTYGWYSNVANYSATVDYTNNVNYKPWRYYYRVIKGANDVIDDLGGTDADATTFADADDRHAFGQAKALRAYAYFYLMQLYTTKYDANADSIPVYTSFIDPAQPLSSQSDVYALIIEDLNTAITLLEDFQRPVKGMIDKNVAKGLLAYTYAAMGEDANAAALSTDLINNSGYPLTTVQELVYSGVDNTSAGFNNLSTPSWMWGFGITVNNNINLISWWGQVDIFTYGYTAAGDAKVIDLGLYDAIPSDDIRKQQFIAAKKYPANKFFAPKRKVAGQRTVETDYIYMRIDEFHLLAAECLAKSGDESQAKTILKNFLNTRTNDVSYVDGLSGDALKNEIYKQTRIEFWGEGKSYLAMKRNQATITRGSNHLTNAGQSYSYDSDELSLDIPQQEVLNNPNL